MIHFIYRIKNSSEFYSSCCNKHDLNNVIKNAEVCLFRICKSSDDAFITRNRLNVQKVKVKNLFR
jgi:hypothetical protein